MADIGRTMTRALLVLSCALALVVAPVRQTAAQDVAAPVIDQQSERGPRFLYLESARATPRPLDMRGMTVLHRALALDLDGIGVKAALTAISRQSGLDLAYSDRDLPAGARVHLKANRISVAAALTEVLLDAGLDVVFTASGSATLVRRSDAGVPAAVGTITGQVTDSLTSQGIFRATVSVQGTSLSTLTDAEGRFTIRQVPVGDRVVAVRFLGYTAATRSVNVAENETATVTFFLVRSPTALDQVVSTATGEQRYRELGHVVARINVDSLVKEAPVKSLSELLTARVPGLQVMGTSGGSVGGEVAVRIRGTTTTSLDPQPIVVVDGVRYRNTNTVNGMEDVRPFNSEPRSPLNDLNVNDIETVEVVKGPSASTLYGPDAANGVIVITTKRGRAGKPQWHVYAYPDLSTLSVGSKGGRLDHPMYQGWGHVPTTLALYEGQCTLRQQAAQQCVLDSLVVVPSPSNDPQLSVLAKNRPQWHSGVSVGGGTSGLSYFFSGNLDSQTGALRLSPKAAEILKNLLGTQALSAAIKSPNSQQSFSLHTNVSSALSSTSNVTLVANYAQVTQRAVSASVLGDAYAVPPFTPGQTFTARDSLNMLSAFTNASAFLSSTQMHVRRLTAALSGNVRPRKWLSANASVGVDLGNTTDRAIRPSSSLYQGDPGEAGDDRRNYTNRDAHLSTTATAHPGVWSLRTSMGVDYHYTSVDGLNTYGSSLAPGSSDITTASFQYLSRMWTESVQLGGYGEEVVGLHDRLFLTGSLRLDGSTTFGDAYAPKPYPKVGLSWVVSDEPFLRKVHAHGLDELRLRSSYGAASRYPTSLMKNGVLQAYNTATENTTMAAFFRGLGGNPELRPERSSEAEFGVDATVASVIRIGLTWYDRRTKDALQMISGPEGMLGGFENVADLSAHGFEATLGARIFGSNRATLDLNFSYSEHSNIVKSLGSNTGNRGPENGYAVGYPLGAVFGTRTLGYVDSVGGGPDGIISESSEVLSSGLEYLGTNFAPRTYTFTPTLALFGARVRVAALFDRQAGGVQIDYLGTCYNNPALCTATFLKSTPLLEQAVNLGLNSADYVRSSDFMRWRELSVTGELPLSVRQRLRLSRASASFQVRNLVLWTPSKAPDPESYPGLGTIAVGGSSRGAAGVPQPRVWTIRFDIAP